MSNMHTYDGQPANLSPKNSAVALKNLLPVMEMLLASTGPGKTITFNVYDVFQNKKKVTSQTLCLSQYPTTKHLTILREQM